MYKGYWYEVGQMWLGYGDSLYELGEGIYFAGRHPIQTVQGVGSAIYHYDETIDAIWNDVVEKSGTTRGQGCLVGSALQSLLPAKYATETIKASRLAKRARAIARLNRLRVKGKLGSIADRLLAMGVYVDDLPTPDVVDDFTASFQKTYSEINGTHSTGGTCSSFGPRTLSAAEVPKPKPGSFTEPSLPSRVIADDGGITLEHYYRSNDHLPPHAHINGGGPPTKIGANGKPIHGSPELTSAQKTFVNQHITKIRRDINKIRRWLIYRNWIQ